MHGPSEHLDPGVAGYVGELARSFDRIAEPRRQRLAPLESWIRDRLAHRRPCRLTFICTHNSRRSHMGQIWAQTAAAYHGIDGIETYSGGTEVTAFDRRAVAALQRAGLRIEGNAGESNPVYVVRFHASGPEMRCFSKRFGDPSNPGDGFCAVMTCSEAEQACPYVPGADARVSLPYEDPKAFDGTPDEDSVYDERCRQICREMLWVFSRLR